MRKTLPDIVPIGIGYYIVPEAARLLKVEPRNITRWLGGHSDTRKRGSVTQMAPLWRPQLPRLGDNLELGFRDLIELRFVVAFLRRSVGLNVIRRCHENASKIIGDERPFSTPRFRIEGKSIFLDSLAETERAEPGGSSASELETGPTVFEQVVEPTFRDLDLTHDSVVQWRPYRGKPSIVIDPTRSFGKPLAADYGVPTEALANAARAENSRRRAARLFAVPLPIVDDAIAFEHSLMAS